MFINDLTDLLTAQSLSGDRVVNVGIIPTGPNAGYPGLSFTLAGAQIDAYMGLAPGPPPLGTMTPTLILGGPLSLTAPIINDPSRIYLDARAESLSTPIGGAPVSGTFRTGMVGAGVARLKGGTYSVTAPLSAGTWYSLASGLITPRRAEYFTAWTTAGQHILGVITTGGLVQIRSTPAVGSGALIVVPSHLYDTTWW